MYCDNSESKVDDGDGASFAHRTVLCAEAVALLRPAAGRVILDGTLGGGGHAAELLAAGARVIGVDRDFDALAAARERLVAHADRFSAVHGSFADLPEIIETLGGSKVDGVLLDLGVSSWQLDCAARGFSFQVDGRLDMRMDQSGPITAADIVNTWDCSELAALFRRLGEEPSAKRIAMAIERARGNKPFTRTRELAELLECELGQRGRRHPATRVFQALRMEVNQELEGLAKVLDDLPEILTSGARAVVITFHSLEDRLVKHDFRQRSAVQIDRPEWPHPRPNPQYAYHLLTRKPILPGCTEVTENPRSRSAKLRAVERI